MYTLGEKKRAVELYIRYDRSCAAVIHEIGYPCRAQLLAWYREYEKTGGQFSKDRYRRYSDEQKRAAVDHYLEHGRCNARTRRALGYPSQEVLSSWIDELEPGSRKVSTTTALVDPEDRQAAVIALETRTASADIIASELGVTRAQLYNWRRRYLGNGPWRMRPDNDRPSDEEVETLLAQVADLRKEVDELELRKAILEGTIDLLGKDRGTDPNRLMNKEKTLLADSLRAAWPLTRLLEALEMSRSSYHYQVRVITKGDKHIELRKKVRDTFTANRGRYGRRRIHDELAACGTVAAERVISAIMKEEGLVARGSKRRKNGYSSYKGEISEHPGNKVNRDFHSALPNLLWLTDVTQFSIPAGKVYLSPVIDCFDGLVVSHTLSTSPDAEMANSMLRGAVSVLGPCEKPVIHSDCGCHYRWPGWISICDEAGLARSMSKKGCSPDNSACEGFFGRLKNEMFYGRDWSGVTIDEFMQEVDAYIGWYNAKRIKRSLGSMSPLDYRRSLGLAA